MQIKGPDYRVIYDQVMATIIFEGVLRLRGTQEYASIAQLLQDVVAESHPTITLDLRHLRFLNSAGINMLFKFIIHVRELGQTQVIVDGSSQISWQVKSLKNLQRLMPTLELRIF